MKNMPWSDFGNAIFIASAARDKDQALAALATCF